MFMEQLHQLSDIHIVTAQADMEPHLIDWRRRHRGNALAIVFPQTIEATACVVKLCYHHGIKIFPQGGNTSTCGGSVPDRDGHALVINMARLNRIEHIDPQDDSMIVQAGCILADVQNAAAQKGRLFPMSLGAEGSCQIGGNIATNAGGTAVVRYGNMRDLVLGLEFVTPQGEVVNALKTLRKNNSGYDLKNLLAGSEGTLGIITRASLKLFPLPDYYVTALVSAQDIEALCEAAQHLKRYFSASLSALEIISKTQMDIVLRHAPTRRLPLTKSGNWYLLVELSGFGEAVILEDALASELDRLMQAAIFQEGVLATSEKQRADIWGLRHHITESNVREGMGITHDIAVPIGKVAQFLALAEQAFIEHQLQATPALVGHLGDGNLHYIVMFPHEIWKNIPNKTAMGQKVGKIFYDIADRLGGTFSAEHGIGSIHVKEMQHYKSQAELDVMHSIKAALDPQGLLNPGRVLPPLAG